MAYFKEEKVKQNTAEPISKLGITSFTKISGELTAEVGERVVGDPKTREMMN